jgi:hypothetical protein
MQQMTSDDMKSCKRKADEQVDDVELLETRIRRSMLR